MTKYPTFPLFILLQPQQKYNTVILHFAQFLTERYRGGCYALTFKITSDRSTCPLRESGAEQWFIQEVNQTRTPCIQCATRFDNKPIRIGNHFPLWDELHTTHASISNSQFN